MTITMTLAVQGIIDLPAACALILGENIGTTIVANIAAIGNGPLSAASLAYHLAMFHTMFNIINTSIFLPFVTPLAWLARKIVPDQKDQKRPVLQYIDAHLSASIPLALHAVRQEIKSMTEDVSDMLDIVLQVVESPESNNAKLASTIANIEHRVDYLEKEITEYLVQVTQAERSFHEAREIAGLIAAVNDIERMGDHCEMMFRLLTKLSDQKLQYDEEERQQLLELGGIVRKFLHHIIGNIEHPQMEMIVRARALEETINKKRKQMRNAHIQRLNDQRTTVIGGLIFIDMLTSFEKMGDHTFNLAIILSGER